ncbi:MAG TPA: hypothetical protein VN947_21235 [Polyangia bacterium]|nr:hypothetical protein [Polyangia bacterium]
MGVAIAVAGCGGGDTPCMSMGQMSDVLSRAQMVRLDVYDASAHCDGARVADGAPPPALSKVSVAGQPIKLDVPAGHHVLLLSAFADANGATLVGSACIETDVRANQPACFNLTLADAPDAGAGDDLAGIDGGDDDMAAPRCTTAPDDCPTGTYCAADGNCAAGCKADPDCAATPATPHCHTADHRCVECLDSTQCPLGKECSASGTCVTGCVAAAPNCPTGDQCCSSECIDVSTDLSSCGSCGRACSSAHVNTPGCNNKLCAPTCASGWADCNHPVAPNSDDGCETNIYDPAHCGACGAAACNLAHATSDCPAGSCTVKACSAGYFDCDGKASTGCECPGVDSGAGGCCPGNKCQTAHTDGFGHSFYDCEPSYSETLARDAAKAAGYANPFGNTCGTGNSEKVICGQSMTAPMSCTCWTWSDSASMNNATGRARQNTANSTCYCPSSGDQPWN